MENLVCEPSGEYRVVSKYWLKESTFDQNAFFLDEFFESQTRNDIEMIIGQIIPKESQKHDIKFRWEGGLSELKNEFNGVSLQHHIKTLRK